LWQVEHLKRPRLVARFNQIEGYRCFEFDAGVGRCEVPVGVAGIAVVLPGGDFLDQRLLFGNAPIEALGRQDAEFGFGEIKPAAVLGGVVPFEALDQPPGLGSRKGFVK
jgi:hypothetical protein